MGNEARGAMTTKDGMTRQGVRDLNHYGPRRRKDAPGDGVGDKPKVTSSVRVDEKDVIMGEKVVIK
jgi:hypothetical protein